jgi:hypothetical protein
MSKTINSFWRNYAPTVVLLLFITGLAVWVHSTGTIKAESIPVGMPKAIALLTIGLFAGVLGGLIGTGGCSVMLPAIHFWMGYPAPVAIGTTLFAVIFTALSGGYAHLVRRNLDVNATLWLGSSGILGVAVGSWLFTMLAGHAPLLGLLLGLAFLWPAARMIWESLAAGTRGVKREGATIPASGMGLAALGSVIGILTGLVGLGGGYALVPGLIYLFHAPVYVTMGTSLATMIPLAIVGGGIKLAQGFVDMGAGLLLAGGTIVGAQIGAAVITRFKPATLKLIFGVYFLYVAVKFVTTYFGVTIW